MNRTGNEKRLPWSTFEFTRSRPPSCSTLYAMTARPRLMLGAVLVLGCADSTCSNSRKMLSGLLAGIPQPVSPMTISMGICLEFLRPSVIECAARNCDSTQSCVFHWRRCSQCTGKWFQKRRFLTSILLGICCCRPDLARISDDHAGIPGQIDLEVEALALCLSLVQVRRLHDYRWEVKRFV